MLDEIVSGKGTEIVCLTGEHVFLQGDVDRWVYFVEKGLLKAFYLDPDGREHIKSLLVPGAAIGSLVALTGGGRCSFGLRAIADSRLRAVPYAALKEVADHDLGTARQVMAVLTELAMRKEKREYELLCLSAEERYERFLDEVAPRAPGLSQMDIAAYLGITPPALSRIRRRRGMTSRRGSD
ncbi:Crp/Fnr family transcriptional regulator [Novosphingobium mangrovi (ex Huang et al. 2023)]|uniref:Crp/Fnr family transcriptional regulator n=1 Tax=Novosphingobium mangrovi (ex Huang et al. 2023) TaxID=2976432 RepID=A0ABT2I3I8_9SPHN|nr:Crp/Fnr family transcriptional regulator [Novosphingobium mangrovi (ex Huang et al. 2023)]MCT2399365.1 Crp/Fnr family transcriptional regulator [Novosphingobium mangrovi (ex Huang et al. 2023)]